jgi:hypothetical protein
MSESKPDIPHLEQLAKAATPGPWDVDDEDGRAHITTADGCAVAYPAEFANIRTMQRHGRDNSLATAAHIAANSPSTTLALIAEIRRLREGLREACGDLGYSLDDTPPIKECDARIWRANMAAWKALRAL